MRRIARTAFKLSFSNDPGEDHDLIHDSAYAGKLKELQNEHYLDQKGRE